MKRSLQSQKNQALPVCDVIGNRFPGTGRVIQGITRASSNAPYLTFLVAQSIRKLSKLNYPWFFSKE